MARAERKPIMGVWGRAWTKGARPPELPPPRNSSTDQGSVHEYSSLLRAFVCRLDGQRSLRVCLQRNSICDVFAAGARLRVPAMRALPRSLQVYTTAVLTTWRFYEAVSVMASSTLGSLYVHPSVTSTLVTEEPNQCRIYTSGYLLDMAAVWHSGNGLGRINEVTLHWVRLVLG